MAENLPPNERIAQQPETNERRRTANSGALWGGIALLLIGTYFLLDNLNIEIFNIFPTGFNWWAFFILLPAVMILKRVYDGYQASGERLTRHLRNQLVIGAGLALFAFVMMFNLNMALLWPFMLIAAGVLVLFNVTNQG